MNIGGPVAVMILAGLPAAPANASMLDFKSLDIDFTDMADASSKAAWSEPDILSITAEGLGWDGDAASLRDGWILTEPFPVGLSWRTPYAVSVSVTILPDVREIILNNGQITAPYRGAAYVRYSPDMVHWSNWQVLQDGQAGAAPQEPGRHYHGAVQVPGVQREEYGRLLGEFARLDVPWKSDEEAACRWIIEEDPGFFEENLPFIGYLEFLFEGSFHGGQRIESLRAEMTYSIGGVHYPPENDEVYEERDSGPWSFTGL